MTSSHTDDRPAQWEQIVTCCLCGHTSRAQWKRSGHGDNWLCLSRRACSKRQGHNIRRGLRPGEQGQ